MQQRPDDRLPLDRVEWRPAGRLVFEEQPAARRPVILGESEAAPVKEAELVSA